MTDKTAAEPARTRPLADVLQELAKGRIHTDASAKLQELVAAVADVRKPGSLTLTIKVTPDKGTEMVRVAATAAVKIPQFDRDSLFYVDDDHNLVRSPPENANQPHLPIALVTDPEADTR